MKQITYWFLQTSLLLLLACTDRENVAPELTTLPNYIQDQVKQNTQTFTFNSANYQNLNGREGTTISFQPNSFRDKKGKTVFGNVQVELIEIYDKASMILMNKPAISMVKGEVVPLISGGEFFFTRHPEQTRSCFKQACEGKYKKWRL